MILRVPPLSAVLLAGLALAPVSALAQAGSNFADATSKQVPAYSGTVIEDIIARVNDQVISKSDFERAQQQLEQESQQQAAAVTAAERSLELAINQYQGGITAYLQVITAQAIALSNEETAVQLLTKRMVACVSLIQAIGGDFNVAGLPAPKEIAPWKGVRKIAEKVPSAGPTQ